MKNQKRVTDQIKSNFLFLAKLYLPSLLILIGILLIRIFFKIPTGDMTRDTVQIMHGNPFYMPGHFIFEDGLKFFAIVTWMGYFIRACNQALCKNR